MSRGSLDCHAFELRIHQILDDRQPLTGDAPLMEHAGHCAPCRKILQEYESVDDSVKLLPADVAQILALAQENTERQQRPRLASRRLVVLASLAAMIVIMLNVMQGVDDGYDSNQSVAIGPSQPSFEAATHSILPTDPATRLAQPRELVPPQPEFRRATPDSSPFSPEFSFVSSMPSLEIPTAPNWDDISKGLAPLESVFNYSLSIPAVRPVPCSLNAGLNFLKRSLDKPDRKPDLGLWIDPNMLAAV